MSGTAKIRTKVYQGNTGLFVRLGCGTPMIRKVLINTGLVMALVNLLYIQTFISHRPGFNNFRNNYAKNLERYIQ